MSETASGLARVAMLLLATMAFAAVWKGDQQTQQQFIIARKEAALQAREVLLARTRDVVTPIPTMSVAVKKCGTESLGGTGIPACVSVTENSRPVCHQPQTGMSAPPSSAGSYVARVEIEMRLPAGITTGSYQVVDQTGATQTIRISADHQQTPGQDIYVLDRTDGSRRFFIRITGLAEQPTGRRAAAQRSASVR